jgi:hypothetical protein
MIAGLGHHGPAQDRFQGDRIDGSAMRLVRHFHSDWWIVRELLAGIPKERSEFRINS